MKETAKILEEGKRAKELLRGVSPEAIDRALLLIADEIEGGTGEILAANAEDVARVGASLSPVMLDRLKLDEKRVRDMANGVRAVAKLPSPLGKRLSDTVRPNGLRIEKITVPIGLLAIIYESRPNVTSDAAVLSLKSGNAVILRAGKEAFRSAFAITAAIRRGLSRAGLPEAAVSLIEDTTRESATALMRAVGYVDLLIPRGGAGLIRACVENALVPCIETGTGICHIYVDRAASLPMALSIVENAKTSRPSVCNAAEALLVHRDVIGDFLPALKEKLVDERIAAGKPPVEFRADDEAFPLVGGTRAEKNDFDTEFLDYILAVKTVGSVEEAVEHIRLHSTAHSEAIVTEDEAAASSFIAGVDSAAVYVNASTRFTDGGEFGFGCEMGISTQKLHARGPMGLSELVTYQYVIHGNGQIR